MIRRASIAPSLICVLFFTTPLASEEGDVASRIEAILSQHSNYAFDQSLGWQTEALQLMREAYEDEVLARRVETIILDFLNSGATYAAKKKIWLDFANIASERSIPVLIDLLDDVETSQLALLTLERADFGEGALLERTLAGLSDDKKISVLHHFGDNRFAAALPTIERMLTSENPRVATAAYQALGKIGSPEAADVFLEQLRSSNSDTDGELLDAALTCATRLLDAGERRSAQKLYRSLHNPEFPLPTQAAALNGLFRLSPNPEAFLVDQLKRTDPSLRPHVLHLTRDLPDTFENGLKLVEQPGLTPADKAQLLLLLAARGDPSIRDFAMRQLTASDPNLRKAANMALPQVATPSDVDDLLSRVDDSSGYETDRIAAALSRIPGYPVDSTLIGHMRNASEDQLVILLEVARNRNLSSIIEFLFELTESEDRRIRREAFKTLEALADHKQLPRALNTLLRLDSPSERRAWERTVYRLAQKNPNESRRSDEIVAKLKESSKASDQSSLILILGEIGNPNDIEVIRPYLESEDATLKQRAAEALSKWPNADPTAVLIDTFLNAKQADVRVAALDGVLRLINENNTVPDSEKLEKFQQLLRDTQSPAEEKLVISAIGEVETVASLDTLVSLLQSSPHKSDVESSIRAIMRNVYRNDKTAAQDRILLARKLSKNESFKEWVDDGLRKERFAR